MDMPIALQRMLESACVNDQLKNWSIYEEKDGVYTFKIRFISQEKRHIESSATGSMENTQVVNKCAFKQKSAKQLERDSARNKAWQQRRISKSQTAETNVMGNSSSPVEQFRQSGSMGIYLLCFGFVCHLGTLLE